MQGKLNIFPCRDTSGAKPHFKGYIKINDEDHEIALWPAKSGNGFSGTYKAKTVQEARQEIKQAAAPLIDDEIPF